MFIESIWWFRVSGPYSSLIILSIIRYILETKIILLILNLDYFLILKEEVGCWRGDPGRQITVFDTPGISVNFFLIIKKLYLFIAFLIFVADLILSLFNMMDIWLLYVREVLPHRYYIKIYCITWSKTSWTYIIAKPWTNSVPHVQEVDPFNIVTYDI